MKIIDKQVIVIGGGPAGLAAAVRLHRLGVQDVLVLEREAQPGGILRQCIHDGFGLTRFSASLSGPEYAQRFIDEAFELGIELLCEATVLGLTKNRVVTVVCRQGLQQYQAQAVVLAMGCRERTRGALSIPGSRPAGVFTAGVAQAYINLKNTMVGRDVVILGSGDVGMIMARRLTLEGAKVHAVFEILPYPSGLPRNIEQCLNDYGIPLHLSHTVTDIVGKARIQAVRVSRVDGNLRPIPGAEQEYPCDALILSVGLIPENELSLMAGVVLDARTGGAVVDQHCQTVAPGIFAAGNVLQVHDLVDYVSLEAEHLAQSVANYLDGGLSDCAVPVEAGEGVGYALPQKVNGEADVTLSLRVRRPMGPCTLRVLQDGSPIAEKKMKKALPAEMERIDLAGAAFLSHNPVKVVVECD